MRLTRLRLALAGLALLAIGLAAVRWLRPGTEQPPVSVVDLPRVGFPAKRSEAATVKQTKSEHLVSRGVFEQLRLRDPRTGRVPYGIRTRELAFAQRLPVREMAAAKAGGLFAADWSPQGPNNVGGRTRALAIDLDYNGTTNRRILAGGTSGGMYLSEDGGNSWRLVTDLAHHASVTSLAQDPNDRRVWYHGTGELLGASAAGGGNLMLWGHGIFKSTDGGLTWSQLPSTIAGNQEHVLDRFFDVVWNLAVHPQGSTVFAATLGGLFRSTDGGGSWEFVLGRDAAPNILTTDVAVGADGAVYAALGRNGNNYEEYGIYRSTDLGNSWTNITPPQLVQDPHRIVLGPAPSDPNTLYIAVQANENGAVAADHQLLRFDAASGNWTDLSAGLPNVTTADEQGNQPAVGNASFSSQGGYDLVVKVKPDDPEVVWIGGTNLYRSTDGGRSFRLVGGYRTPYSYHQFENHHSDQHAIAFFPNDPNAMISGHDGGLSLTTNALEPNQTWRAINNGYVTTQFYALAVDPQPGSPYMIGGTQDNGTWHTTGAEGQAWRTVMGGDGGYAAVAPGGLPFYLSAQLGYVLRATVSDGQLVGSVVKPAGVEESQFMFITPFLLDPADPRVLFMAVGDAVWRNSNLDAIPVGNGEATSINWNRLSASAEAGTMVTTLSVGPQNGRLYFGATNFNNRTVIKRVDNPAADGPGTAITPPGLTQGSYPSSIGINPQNDDELVVVLSNYGVPSLWHSTDGGASWTDIEGNLAGDDAPSIRSVAIVPTAQGTLYVLGTSTGVYSTTQPAGAGTQWQQEGAATIGRVVTDMIVTRPADGLIVAATHGRGVYSASVTTGGPTGPVAQVSAQEIVVESPASGTGSASFALSNTGGAALTFTITASEPVPAKTGGNGRAAADLVPPTRPRTPSSKPGLPSAAGVRGPGSGARANDSLTDVLILDDGDDAPDDFFGWSSGAALHWANVFEAPQGGFQLEEIRLYMRSESKIVNAVSLQIADTEEVLWEGTANLSASRDGTWYALALPAPMTFEAGENFFITIGAASGISFPAGYDANGNTPGRSLYYDWNTSAWTYLTDVQGFEQAAFLIRAAGTAGSSTPTNQAPRAVAQLSKTTANPNESITFDASGSSDPDGSIAAYRWSFGDGNTSAQQTATHAYAAPGSYAVTLTVTDDKGATGTASAQVTITSPNPSARVTVTPANGTVAPGGTQPVQVTVNAAGLAAGTYAATLQISTNGGNVNLPVRLVVGSSVAVEAPEGLPDAFALDQNFPNPFNPETTIRYALRAASRVELGVYDVAGREVATLVTGPRDAGTHFVRWDGRDVTGRPVPSGPYFYRLLARMPDGSSWSETRQMVLLK